MPGKLQGAQALKNALRRQAELKRQKLAQGVADAAKYLLAQSNKLVPVDYGILKASGHVEVEGKNTASPKGKVIYDAGYAIYVHEDLTKAHGAVFNAKYAAELAHAKKLRRKKQGGTTGPYRHNRGENQQAKFLEIPFRQDRKILKAIIADRVKEQ